ncbi:hypothetical protein ACMAUO_15850 [Gluconacetobacter sp. Hr-1-5]|uniref:hypothetical protein n=1 Tax=Gluconacetobacter sp. Hr-1-5 TaxID=3395370 RepID=UPI003B51D494
MRRLDGKNFFLRCVTNWIVRGARAFLVPKSEDNRVLFDMTIVVSETEREILSASVPRAPVLLQPLVRDIVPPTVPFSARREIGFVGGLLTSRTWMPFAGSWLKSGRLFAGNVRT